MANESERFLVISKTFDVLKDIVRAVTYIALAYWAFRAIEALSGKHTDASLLVSYFTAQENDYGFPWVIAVIGVIYGLIERKLRLRKTEYFTNIFLSLKSELTPREKEVSYCRQAKLIRGMSYEYLR